MPANAEIRVDTSSLELSFSPYGDLLSAVACLPDCQSSDGSRQVFTSYRGFVSINRDSDSLFQLQRHNGEHSIELEFVNLVSSESRRWRIPHLGYQIGLEVSRPQALSMTSELTVATESSSGFSSWFETVRYIRKSDQQGWQQTGQDESAEPVTEFAGWAGFRNRFWAAVVQSNQPLSVATRNIDQQSEMQLDLSMQKSAPIRYAIYAGPVEPEALAAANPELRTLIYPGLWNWLKWVSGMLFLMLSGIHRWVPDWALAIIVLSALVHIVMWPLNRYAQRLQNEVKDTEVRLAPRLREIKQTLKGAEQAERILELYKSENVHPLYSFKGLAGVLFVIPVFVGAFNMLAENPWLANQSFLWISDLSSPDAVARLPFRLPFFGDAINLLPFLMTAFNLLAAKFQNQNVLDPQTRQQLQRRMWIMAIIFFLLFYTFPAAMVLYWTVNNAIAAAIAAWTAREATV